MKIQPILIIILLCLAKFSDLNGQNVIIDSLVVLPNSQYDREKKVFISPKSNIQLNYQQNFFFLYFHTKQASKGFTHWTENLDGNIKHYEIETKDNYVYFSNLPSGEFIFNIRDSSVKDSETHLKIIIKAPFWFQWWFPILVFFMILAVAGIILYIFFLYRLRQQLRLQAVRHELEIKALRAQMNPHFIFNSMNTIDAYILRKRFVEASDCLQKFSKLIRQILENSENQTISISAELETLKLYIELEQERFSHSFSYVFDIEPALLEKEYQIPPLLIQPFVENAILHGIRHLTERKGEILVKLFVNSSSPPGSGGEVLFCQIQDNGIGRKASSIVNQQRQENHKSMGVDITMERIATYQALYGSKMETNIIDLEEGTMIEIKLPLIDTNL